MGKKKKLKKEIKYATEEQGRFCSLPQTQPRNLSHISNSERLSFILLMGNKWVNGTNLTYYSFKEPIQWLGEAEQEEAIREAFATWESLGIEIFERFRICLSVVAGRVS